MNRARWWILVSIALLPAKGCGALANREYAGESLMRIEGSIVSTTPDLPPMEVALLWELDPDTGGCDKMADRVARVSTEGSFPSAFRLVVTQPPPEEVFPHGSQVAQAYIAALDGENRLFGLAADSGKTVYKVFYTREDITAGSEESRKFGGTGLKAGYQLGTWDLASAPAPTVRLALSDEPVTIEIFDSPGSTVRPGCTPRPEPPPPGSGLPPPPM